MTLSPLQISNSSVKKDITRRLYRDIRLAYSELYNIKENDVRVYSHEYILAELSRRFYRSPKTIENIIFNRV